MKTAQTTQPRAGARLAVYPLLLLLIGVALIAYTLSKGGVPDVIELGKGGLKVDFGSSASGQQVLPDEVRSAQSELQRQIDDLEAQAQDESVPATPSDAVVAGTWQGDNGFTYVLQQFGTSVVLQERSEAYGITATGSGWVSGSTVTVEYQAANWTRGTAQLQVTSTGSLPTTLSGEFLNDTYGSMPVTLTRTGP
jgi:hypothetical protein